MVVSMHEVTNERTFLVPIIIIPPNLCFACSCQKMMSPQIKQTAVNPRTIAVNSRTTIVVKGNTTHNDGYETPLKEVVAEQQEHPSLKTAQHQQASGQAATISWLATPGQSTGAGSSVRDGVIGVNVEGGGRARRKRTHVEYAEDAQEAQAVRRAAAEEARRRRTQGQTGVRVGRKWQAEVPDWAHGREATAPGLPPDRNDEIQLAHLRHE